MDCGCRPRLRANRGMGNLSHRFSLLILLVLLGTSHVFGKTVYVHLVDGNDQTADGSYERPFKSWRTALRHVGSGDTLIAKNGDYRKAGQGAKWGGLDLVLTLEDRLEEGDPRPKIS